MSLTTHNLETQRPIRSYVRREGRITKGQNKALQRLWSKYGIDNNNTSLTSTNLFGNSRQMTLEIGFGNGQNLIDQALSHPDCGYVGIDVYRPGAGRLILELDRLAIRNVRIILQDATETILHRFADKSLDQILIYFPDPWPKKRHHKRRLIDPDFLHRLAHRLKPRGILHIATDCNSYADSIVKLILLESLLIKLDSTNDTNDLMIKRATTKYEARGERLGNRIFDILASRL